MGKDVRFRGVLAKRVKPGEDPSWKLAELYKVLEAETDKDAVLTLAKLTVEGFKERRQGRPRFLNACLKRDGSRVELPPWVVALLEERLFSAMEHLAASAARTRRRLKTIHHALTLGETWFLKKHWDSKASLDKFARAAAEAFHDRAERRAEHDSTLSAMKRNYPHWDRYADALQLNLFAMVDEYIMRCRNHKPRSQFFERVLMMFEDRAVYFESIDTISMDDLTDEIPYHEMLHQGDQAFFPDSFIKSREDAVFSTDDDFDPLTQSPPDDYDYNPFDERVEEEWTKIAAENAEYDEKTRKARSRFKILLRCIRQHIERQSATLQDTA
jgi:hypothetical protein